MMVKEKGLLEYKKQREKIYISLLCLISTLTYVNIHIHKLKSINRNKNNK